MKLAIVGSRSIRIDNLELYLPDNVSDIVSGGANGVDKSAKEFAIKNSIKYTEFLPKYNLYKRGAPLKRNIEIINYCDELLIFWDQKSKGTKFVIENSKKLNKKFRIITL